MTHLTDLSQHESTLLDSYLLRLCDFYERAEPLLRRRLYHAEQHPSTHISTRATLHLNLGRVLLYQDRTLEALREFKRALDLSRDCNDAATFDAIRRYRLMFEMSA